MFEGGLILKEQRITIAFFRPSELQVADVKIVESATCERWHKESANINVL